MANSNAQISQEAKKQQLLKKRQAQFSHMQHEFGAIIKSLGLLAPPIPEAWVERRLPHEASFDDIIDKMDAINSSLTLYKEGLDLDPDSVPDTGDKWEITHRFQQIKLIIEALKRLLPEAPTDDGFVKRLQSGLDDNSNKLTSATIENDSITIQKDPEERAVKKFAKKDSKYHIPGMFAKRIKHTITALEDYAFYAAPLIGATFQITGMTNQKRSDQSVAELRDFSIIRESENPVDFGVSQEWVDELDLKISLYHDSGRESKPSAPSR